MKTGIHLTVSEVSANRMYIPSSLPRDQRLKPLGTIRTGPANLTDRRKSIYSLIPVLAILPIVLGGKPLWSQQSSLSPQTGSQRFDEEKIEFFEKKIRPVLVENCQKCHDSDAAKREGGLSVRSRRELLSGGESGPAIVVGNPQKSLLIDAVNHGKLFQMPPDRLLPAQSRADLRKWIQEGAAWPGEETTPALENKKEFDLESRRRNHWCWQPVRNIPPPPVQQNAWIRDPIDRFILNRLEVEGMSPAAVADRRTLIRRVYFDLKGLPPSAQQVREFLNDDSPRAYEKVVDQLLSSDRFGEKWARHWLDLVRYAESYGHQYDFEMKYAWRYRDYLIRALNQDVAYDQLIMEHLAGDLLHPPRRNLRDKSNESILGTAFWYLGQAKPSAVDSRANEVEMIENQIDVMSKAFLGLTVSCARCHDHKFDAISSEDYYALVGFLQSSRRQLCMLDPNQKILDHFQKSKQLIKESDSILNSIESQIRSIDYRRLADYLAAGIEFRQSASGKLKGEEWNAAIRKFANTKQLSLTLFQKVIKATSREEIGESEHALHLIDLASSHPTLKGKFAESIARKVTNDLRRDRIFQKQSRKFADFKNGLPDGWFRTGFAFGDGSEKPSASLNKRTRLAYGSDSIIGRLRFVPAGTLDSGRFGNSYCGVIRSPTFQLKHKKLHYRLMGKDATVRVIINGFFMDQHRDLLFRGVKFDIRDSNRFRWQTQKGDISNHVGATAHIEILDHGRGRVAVDEIRFSDELEPVNLVAHAEDRFTQKKNLESASALCSQLLARLQSARVDRPAIYADFTEWLFSNDLIEGFQPEWNRELATPDPIKNRERLVKLSGQFTQIDREVPLPKFAIGITDGTPEEEWLMIRGNHLNTGKLVPRRFLTAIDGRSLASPDSSGRLELAKRLTSKTNPLTARVAVNRVWYYLMGRGIVPSLDNFGKLGSEPTHPGLLDHLAAEFQTNRWSLKRLIRKIVLSQTYQMSSRSSPELDRRDPANRLFHRHSTRRLPAESIRDSILSVSGELNQKMFGPPVPVHLTPFMTGRGRPRKSGPVDGTGRRSVYLSVRRNFLSPMLLAYDFPVPLTTTGQRNQSNLPAQALILMNSPFANQQAEAWAKNLLRQDESMDERIKSIYQTAFARLPVQQEIDEAREFLRSISPDSLDRLSMAQRTVVWKEYCHIVFNLKEFIFIR